MSTNIEKAQHHGVGDDVILKMGHKKYMISMAYAKGLFHFGINFNLLGPIRRSFDEFIIIWQEFPIVKRFIQCHAIDRITRKERISHFFRDRFHRVFIYFIEKLIDNNHIDLIAGIYNIFCQKMDELGHKHRVRVISAFPMNQSQLERLRGTMDDLLKSKVLIENEVCPEILGGFVCYTDSIKIDMSLRKDLNRLRYKILSMPNFEDKK